MKKTLVALSLLALTGSAMAQHHGHGFRHHNYHRGPGFGWWVAPVVVGTIGYELGRQQVVIQQPPPVVIQQPPVTYQLNQTCSPWTETQNPDGTITRTRTCAQ